MKTTAPRSPGLVVGGLVISLLLLALDAEAGTPRYALVIGNNRPPVERADLPSLRYADDDAVRYQDLSGAWAPRPTS